MGTEEKIIAELEVIEVQEKMCKVKLNRLDSGYNLEIKDKVKKL